ncbi:outer membrane protein [Bartonella sp. CB189]|uniref:outer membrane protein n=1 Tax=Bartonella sp. CB189 TaxID=3112254 RepID=UPI002F962569
MNVKYLAASSVVALITVSTVQAADITVSRDPAAAETVSVVSPPFSWTGFYVGGQIGNFSSAVKADRLGGEQVTSVGDEFLPKLSGFMGGLYVGSNVDLGNGLVLGVDTDFVWINKSNEKSLPKETVGEGDIPVINQMLNKAHLILKEGDQIKVGNEIAKGYSLKEKWTGATRVRIGFSANRILPYVSGGIAYTQLKNAQTVSVSDKVGNNLISGDLFDEKKAWVGYTLGAGIDLAMTDNVILRAEYRYSDFGKKKLFNEKLESSYKTNDFRFGMAYKF